MTTTVAAGVSGREAQTGAAALAVNINPRNAHEQKECDPVVFRRA